MYGQCVWGRRVLGKRIANALATRLAQARFPTTHRQCIGNAFWETRFRENWQSRFVGVRFGGLDREMLHNTRYILGLSCAPGVPPPGGGRRQGARRGESEGDETWIHPCHDSVPLNVTFFTSNAF